MQPQSRSAAMRPLLTFTHFEGGAKSQLGGSHVQKGFPVQKICGAGKGEQQRFNCWARVESRERHARAGRGKARRALQRRRFLGRTDGAEVVFLTSNGSSPVEILSSPGRGRQSMWLGAKIRSRPMVLCHTM